MPGGPVSPAPGSERTGKNLDTNEEAMEPSGVGAFAGGHRLYSGFTSSNVTDASYDPENNFLKVGFGGKGKSKYGRYGYHDVSPAEARSFYGAGSKGKWVWDHLRVRGTVFGFQKPYVYLGAESSGYSPKYINKHHREWKVQHQRIGPEGALPEHWKKGHGPYHHMAGGGVVPGAPGIGPDEDRVPIMATAGEGVVTKDAMKDPANAKAVEAMNAGEQPGMISRAKNWAKKRYGSKTLAAGFMAGQLASWGATAGLSAASPPNNTSFAGVTRHIE